jgi:glycosyltransferase involved in cell wall biosynthesis
LSPLASVIIPNYNRADLLAEAIDSALSQTYSPLEVIVVDDGSTDHSLEVACSFGERIRLLTRENAGVSAARNTGIEHARGEYIVLLDSDDRMLPDCVQARIDLLTRTPDAAICIGSFYTTDPDGRQTGTGAIGAEPPGDHLRHAVRQNWGPTCGAIIRKDAMKRCGPFDPLLRVCEDWDLLIRLSSRFRFCADPVPRAEYRIVPGSLSRDVIRMYDGAVTVMLKNRVLARSRRQFYVDSNIGLYNHCMGMVFSRMKAGHLGRDGRRAVVTLLAMRPKVLAFAVVWLLRAAKNRALRLVSRRPARPL